MVAQLTHRRILPLFPLPNRNTQTQYRNRNQQTLTAGMEFLVLEVGSGATSGLGRHIAISPEVA
jgi:hypothetical protein